MRGNPTQRVTVPPSLVPSAFAAWEEARAAPSARPDTRAILSPADSNPARGDARLFARPIASEAFPGVIARRGIVFQVSLRWRGGGPGGNVWGYVCEECLNCER